MYCICLASPQGKDSFKINTSCEIIGFHQNDDSVSILVYLIIESLKIGPSLQMLHPGKTTCTMVQPIPLPNHSDECGPNEKNFLNCIYSELQNVGTLKEIKNLFLKLGIDYNKYENASIMPWQNAFSDEQELAPMYNISEDKYVPFTLWDLGPSSNPGIYALAFHMVLTRNSISQATSADCFTVDGPERILHRILTTIHSDFYFDERKTWIDRLGLFSNPDLVLMPDTYDIGILGTPFADEVETIGDYCQDGVYLAPEQLFNEGRHYIALKSTFSLPLSYKNEISDPYHCTKR